MKKPQLFYAIVFILFALLPISVSAKDEWLQVRSKNFNLIGNASERDVRKVATKLEQFRETFRQLFNSANLNSNVPTNVVVFKSAGAYKPFKPVRADGKVDTNIAGYFQPGEDVNYITISTEGEDADTYGTIFHEYVHEIINTNFGKSEVPPWFNEGVAEYYQTFAIEEDQKVKLGLPQGGHLQLLQQNRLIPLETLFKISNYALHQNANHSRSVFYAQSWALIHYLIQSGKTAGLGEFLTLSMKDVPPEKAFQKAFQTTYQQMEQDLRKYVAQNSYKYSLVSFKNKLIFDHEMQTTPLSEAESNAYLGDLLYHTNRADDAESYLQKAVAIKPDSSFINTTLGMVKLRQRKYDEAKKYLEKAVSADQKNHLAFYRYAELLSRENRDEFGFVSSFPAEKLAKMRDLLKKAIAINPNFTESYELLTFVNLVSNEQLDEAVAYLQKALKYQPGNQRYALRIGEIYLRQEKFKEAAAIADKIAKTADEPEIKSRAENLSNQLQQQQEMIAQNAAARKQFEEEVAEANKTGNRPMLTRRAPTEKSVSPEEAAKAAAQAELRSINEMIRKAQTGEKQVIGRIQKIDCKGKNVTYTVETATETFALTSKDFQNLALMSLVADAANAQVGCDADLARINTVLTYKPVANKNNPGELIAVDFVPDNFRLMTAAELQEELPTSFVKEETVAATPIQQNQDFETQRREAMLQAIKNAMRKLQTGEKQELGLLEKIECNNKGSFFYFKTETQMFKLTAASQQSLQIRAYTPEIEQVQFGCGLKQLNVPVVFTFKESSNQKNNSNGEIISLEFVPKSFVLKNELK